MKRIYLDNNGTTGVDPRVLEAILPELSTTPGNPSSIHFFGREAKNRLQKARDTIASFLGVKSQEIFFTSSGTEAINWILRNLFSEEIKGHLISSNVEHACVHNTLLELQKKGAEVSFLPAGLSGAVTPEQVKAAIRPDTKYITLTAVSSETGVKHDVDGIAQIALAAGIPLFIDGVAWLGKELFTLHPGISGIAFSGHKLHAPKGVGFAYVRSSLKLSPLLFGGGQEKGLRSGTENLPGIVGLAKAIELLKEEFPAATERMAQLRDRLEEGLIAKAGAQVNGTGTRICNTSNLFFPGDLGEDLLIALDMAGIAVSYGSACSSGAMEPSRVLLNMGLPPSVAKSSLRFSLSRNTTLEEIDRAIEVISKIVNS